MSASLVQIKDIAVGRAHPLAVISGPCVIEARDHCLRLAEVIRDVCARLGLPYIFKASFDKANRTSADSYRGPGLEEGLRILETVRDAVGVPVLSDIHTPEQAAPAGQVLDVVQIPAFLCRQTDLLLAAAKTGKPVNIKKGQFMTPEQMRPAVDKVRRAGNDNVLLTERGTFFGYGRLVNDFAGLPIMRRFAPVVFDATHSCQFPGAEGLASGGQREMTPYLARAAAAAGIDALFMEVHDRPDRAKSDAATVWPVERLGPLLESCLRIAEVAAGATA
jgi:2-dehydro-3-deoxyphosphooctonate aldolase (KDO 8-P synthase)